MEPQEKILKTALELFFKYGIKRVTMDDIAKELGMSKKTIYQYYDDKNKIVNQLCQLEVTRHEHRFNEIFQTSENPIHEIMLISESLRQMMQNVNPIFFMDLQKYHTSSFEFIQTFKRDCAYKDIYRNIQLGINDGLYRAELDPHFVTTYRLAQIDNLMFGNIFSFEKISFSRAHEFLLDLFIHSICTEKGLQLVEQYKNNIEQE